MELPENMTVNDLPPEMMEKIFEHLTFHERLLISATCKLWHKVIFGPQFCKRLFLHLRTLDDLVKKPYAKEMMGRCRNVNVSCSHFGENELKLLKDYMSGSSLEKIKISTSIQTGKHIVEAALQVLIELETLHLDLQGSYDGEVIQISHPKLKSIVLNGQWNYVIECGSLTTLESNQVNEISAQGVGALRRQLRSLKLSGLHKDLFNAATSDIISSSRWDYLRELCFIYPPSLEHLERMLEKMPCLESLSLYKSNQIITGKELAPATRLSELTLGKQCIETVSLNIFLARSSLHRLSLLNCTFCATNVPLTSDSIERLSFQPVYGELLPLFPNLKVLDVEGTKETDFSSILKQISKNYKRLERLTIGVKCGEIGQFAVCLATEASLTIPFSLPTELDRLKVIQINRMDLNKIDWIACTGSKVEYIRLNGCSINGIGCKNLVQTFKHLRTLYLDHCYLRLPRADLFDIDETCSKGLRTYAPHCKISYYDCHIEDLYDYCGRSGPVI